MIWLTTNIDYAKQFGNDIHKYNAKLNNSLNMSEYDQELPLTDWKPILSDLNIDINIINWDKIDFAPDYGYYYFYDLLPHAGNNYINGNTLNALINAGYDSILTPLEKCEGIKSEITYVILDQNIITEVL
jgi:hypothetical protein